MPFMLPDVERNSGGFKHGDQVSAVHLPDKSVIWKPVPVRLRPIQAGSELL
ncbi:hypothetical protein [Mesorhizobium hawassense]|uniref:hypothetical protein n=1 Tax=Mesorhizobium hawassense TaxID=1209954 RepID=UPI00142E0318|nr:hypothetical protein [Mesorhizobium hawassense]